MAFCKNCGKELNSAAAFCEGCGTKTNGAAPIAPQAQSVNKEVSDKSWETTLLLSIFFGGFGADHFYVGKTVTGIIKLLTLGGCGVWWLIDFIMIMTGKFTDAGGLEIKEIKKK
jgi:TM2 domain-containing membrane protein YozV